MTGSNHLLVPLTKGLCQLHRDKIEIGMANDIALRRSEQALENRIAGKIDALRVLQPDKVGDRINQGPKKRPLRLQGILGSLLRADIDDSSGAAHSTAGSIAHHDTATETHPDPTGFRMPHAALRLKNSIGVIGSTNGR